LQEEFICVRFNQLPKNDITHFIKQICEKEGIQVSDKTIETILNMYNSDVRSMINTIQLNHHSIQTDGNIINTEVWETLLSMLGEEDACHQTIFEFIHDASIKYNIDKKFLLQSFFNFIIRNHPELMTHEFFKMVDLITHCGDSPMEPIVRCFIEVFMQL
jgi:DNA polymerase III delta prime subunit